MFDLEISVDEYKKLRHQEIPLGILRKSSLITFILEQPLKLSILYKQLHRHTYNWVTPGE